MVHLEVIKTDSLIFLILLRQLTSWTRLLCNVLLRVIQHALYCGIFFSKKEGISRFLWRLYGNRNTRNRRYSCSFGTFSIFGMNRIVLRSFCLRHQNSSESTEYGLLRTEGIVFFWKRFRFNRNRQNYILLGTDILCILLFLNWNENSQNCSKRMRRLIIMFSTLLTKHCAFK